MLNNSSALSLLRSILLCTTLSFFRAQLTKDINSPAEGIIESLVTVEVSQNLELGIRDDEIYQLSVRSKGDQFDEEYPGNCSQFARE